MELQRIKGFADILYPESALYAHIEAIARDVFSSYMYKEIRTPLVEYTELFVRGIGTATDVVQKEMYTFADRKERSLTLRPEATAGIVRSYIEHAMQGIIKVFTIGPMFRYERPQKGRMRQFHQVNCECFGVEEPTADVEIIAMVLHFLHRLGIQDTTLLLNSLGCASCRPHYTALLSSYIHTIKNALCDTCRIRMEHNPLRVLDCKEKQCIAHTEHAPRITDCLCEECKEHFAMVRYLLDSLGIIYTLQPRLVRGLDYYSRTTFEIVSHNIGAQSSIAGGGRYDALVENMGGKPTPAIGFACGMERLVLLLDAIVTPKIPYYIAPLCPTAQEKALELSQELRAHAISVEMPFHVVNIKQCMKYAGKHAHYCILIGEEELAHGVCTIKNMERGVQERISFSSCVRYCVEHYSMSCR